MGKLADAIRTAIFGKDARESIAKGIEAYEALQISYDSQILNAGNSNAEIVDSRGTFNLLKDRLNDADNTIKDVLVVKSITKTLNKMINNQPTSIGCIGDSITYGSNTSGGQETLQYPSQLQAYLRRIYNNNNITISNQGKSGYQTATWLDGSPSIYDTTLNNNYDLVIIMLGINDVIGRLGIYVSIDDFKTNLNTMVQKALAKGSEVILMSPTMMMEKTEMTPVTNANSVVLQYSNIIKYVAERNNVCFIDIQQEFHDLFYRKNIFNPFDLINIADSVHLLAKGYDVLAQLVLKNICKHLLVVNSQQQEVPSFGSPYYDTNLIKTDNINTSNVNSTSAQGSPYGTDYYAANGSGGFIKLNCFIDFDDIDMHIVYSSGVKGGLLTVYDKTDVLGTIDYSTGDAALSSSVALYGSSSIFKLSYGFHQIILDVNNLTVGNSVDAASFYMYLEGFRFVKNSQKYNKNSVYNFVHGTYPTQQTLPYFLLTVPANKKLVIEFDGIFDPGTGVAFLGHVVSTTSYNYNALIKHDPATNKVILYSYSQSNQNSAITTNGITALDFSKRHKYVIEVVSNKTVRVYVDGVLEITATLTVGLLTGRFSAWCYDTAIDRKCEIYNLQSYII